ncbi:uncharacterized protein N7518_001659 [Penicillium psychrosexuale]|uniref:uncharacterized protein n=1 Tax=Penicillium psychrosexuale TaxID=1002107 RepID=UPI0025458C33|nr:uncharacterized protein N7518_001659 [Penicillium psychrosexuale]KAJ5799591.1 hypothetical protein N7518_001659 [Penicillium psychrosexuale]
MDQTSAECQTFIEAPDQDTANPEASTANIQSTLADDRFQSTSNTSLIPHLEDVHHNVSKSLRVNEDLMSWPDAWFPGDERLCPLWMGPWIEFPQLQEEMWNEIFNTPELVDARIFPPQVAVRHAAHILEWYIVYSEETLKIFANRSVDDFLATTFDFMEQEDTLRYRFSVRGQLRFDRPRHSCTSVANFGFEEPAYAVLYIPSYCLTLPELVAGLHGTSTMETFEKKPTTFEEHATYVVSRAIVRIYSRMICSGRRYGYIYTGEALVFLQIPPDDSNNIKYYLCVPSRDVVYHGYDSQSEWVRRTTLGQIFAFALQSLAASPPTQEWQDAVYQTYRALDKDNSILLPQTPDAIRFSPPAEFVYETSFWVKFWGNLLLADIQIGEYETSRSQSSELSDVCKPYCTQACLLGTFQKDVLDQNCPNAAAHGTERHQITSQEICDMMNEQLRANRYRGFQQLHIVGRTCYLLKATLLSHGYTMLIKATSSKRSRRINTELKNYQNLLPLQGSKIPVCLGMFSPKIPYWYHGTKMTSMLLISWSGIRADQHTTLETCGYLEQEMQKLEDKLKEHGVVQEDAAFRNVLWNPTSQSFVMVDLEDLKWLGSEGSESNGDSIQSSDYLGDVGK